MARNAAALQIPLNDEPTVEPVDDIDSCKLVYQDGDDDDIPSDTNVYDLMDDDTMIYRSPMGHLFLNGMCIHCGDPVPGTRKHTCGEI